MVTIGWGSSKKRLQVCDMLLVTGWHEGEKRHDRDTGAGAVDEAVWFNYRRATRYQLPSRVEKP